MSAEGGPELAAAHAATPWPAAGQGAGHPVRRDAGPVERHHRRAGGRGRLRDAGPRRVGADRRDRASTRAAAAGAGDPVTAGLLQPERQRRDDRRRPGSQESGTFAGPVAITNTHAVGIAHAGIVAWTVRAPPAAGRRLAAAGGGRDLGRLPQRHQRPPRHRAGARSTRWRRRRPGPVEEGSVGGGTGMNCYQFKGGSGTASRLVGYGGDHLHRRRLRAGQLRPPAAS